VVTLTPTANAGYKFSSWSGAGANGAGNTRVVTVTDNMAVTATFVPVVVTRLTAVIRTGVDLTGGSASFAAVPQQGNLLVVIAGHRSGTPNTNNQPTIDGWTRQDVAYYKTSTNTNDRRIVALFWKIAGPSESSSVTINWHDSTLGANDAGFVILQEFTGANTYSVTNFGRNHGTSSTSTSLNVPSSAISANGNTRILAIAGMVWRDNPFSTDPTFTNLPTQNRIFDEATSVPGASSFAVTTTSPSTWQTTVSWQPARYASGLLVLFTYT
jgi:hypothetical protein